MTGVQTAWGRGEDHPAGAALYRRKEGYHPSDPGIIAEYDKKQNLLVIYSGPFDQLTEAQQHAVYRRTETVYVG